MNIERTDEWMEMDKKQNEIIEFIRQHLPYSESELLEKPILQFVDIFERARVKAEAAGKSQKDKALMGRNKKA